MLRCMKINQVFSLFLNEMCIKVVLLKLTLYRLSYRPVRMPRACKRHHHTINYLYGKNFRRRKREIFFVLLFHK